MNSAQRRKAKRSWLRKNAETIDKIISWINSPKRFVASRFTQRNCIEMEPERMTPFGSNYSFTKEEWVDYLIKKGINPERFRQLPADLKLISFQ